MEGPSHQSQYPTRADILEWNRKIDTLASGANVHNLRSPLVNMDQIILLASLEGWDSAKLEQFNKEKETLNKLLLGLK